MGRWTRALLSLWSRDTVSVDGLCTVYRMGTIHPMSPDWGHVPPAGRGVTYPPMPTGARNPLTAARPEQIGKWGCGGGARFRTNTAPKTLLCDPCHLLNLAKNSGFLQMGQEGVGRTPKLLDL
jgi:hypothetical protein